uniref:Secreted protein n=1 Tax=Echinococcus granulosus TaxID=6210 RepID=A0A068X5J0_ECHGR|nr:hypothetical protein EgrG_002067100 [Echinococcus granulosus]
MGHACEFGLLLASFRSLAALQSPQRANVRSHEKRSSRTVDSTQRILLHDSVVVHTPPTQTMSKVVPDRMYTLLSSSPEQEFEMTPFRTATTTSPFLPDNTVCCRAGMGIQAVATVRMSADKSGGGCVHTLMWIDDGSEDTAMVAANSLSTAGSCVTFRAVGGTTFRHIDNPPCDYSRQARLSAPNSCCVPMDPG